MRTSSPAKGSTAHRGYHGHHGHQVGDSGDFELDAPHRLPSPSAKYARPFRGAALGAIEGHLPHLVDGTCQTETLPQLPSLADLGYGRGDSSLGDASAGAGSSPETLRNLEKLIEAQRAQLVSKGLIVDDHGVPHGSGHASRAERPGLSVQGRGNERVASHGHQPHSPRAGRRSPGSQPKSRRNNSLGGDGDLVYFESPMPNPERRGGNPSPVARPRGPTPRKMRSGNKSSSFDRAHKGSPERADSVQVRDNLAAALGLTLFSPSPPGDGLPAVRTSFEWGEKDVSKLSASPTANRTLHFATRAPSKAATIHVAKPRPRPLSHAPAVARHLGVLEDDSALASPDSEFSSESGSLGVREGAGEGGGAFRSGFHEAVQPRVGSGSGRGAFRVVGSFTPAPSSAFKAVDKRGSASEVEEASERLRRDRKAGSSGLGGSSVLTQSLRRDAFG